jgi:hypothetical protein
MTFASEVRRFTELAERRLKTIVVRSVYQLSANIVYQTPVDSQFGPNGEFPVWYDPSSVGTARGGWTARVSGRVLSSPTDDPMGNPTVNAMLAAFQTYDPRRDTSLGLVNNVPYIRLLEYGGYNFVNPIKTVGSPLYSYQAPQGMVRINAQQWGSIVANVKARIR